MRAPLTLSSCLVAVSLSVTLSAQSDVPFDLMQLVPQDTASVSQWRSDRRTQALEQKVFGVVEAVLDADLDGFLLDSAEILGAPEDVMREVRSMHNLATSMGGLIPWRELLHGEVVYAESNRAGMLLACRPSRAQLEDVERSLAGAMGTVAGMMLMPLRYDVERDDYTGTTLYQINPRGSGRPNPLFQFAVRDGVILLGFGQQYFDEALYFLNGGDGERLASSLRFLEAFGELPEDVAGRTYVDLAMMSDDLEGLNKVLGEREFNLGGLQGMLNGLVDLTGSVETVASVIHCDGDLVSTETLTRFDAESSQSVRAGLAQPASARMMDYIPADAYSFDMRGQVEPAGVFTWLRENWSAGWEPADNFLLAFDLFEAAIGLSMERDVLSWIGSEQVQVHMLSRHSKSRRGPKPGQTDTVTLCQVRDPEGVRKCLERLEGVFNILAPLAVEQGKALMEQIGQKPRISIGTERKFKEYPELRRLRISISIMPLPPIVYGMVDDILVWGTSMEGVQSCLEVAAGNQEGMLANRLVGPLMGRDDLCSARMTPAGTQYAGWKSGLGMAKMGLNFAQQAIPESDPRIADAFGLGLDLLDRLDQVLESLQFMGKTLTHSSIREGGLARYEKSTMELRISGGLREGVAQASESTPKAQPVASTQK